MSVPENHQLGCFTSADHQTEFWICTECLVTVLESFEPFHFLFFFFFTGCVSFFVPHWIKLSVSIFHLCPVNVFARRRNCCQQVNREFTIILSLVFLLIFVPWPSLKCSSFRAHLFCPWLISSSYFKHTSLIFFLWVLFSTIGLTWKLYIK